MSERKHPMLVEVCIDSVRSALNAAKGGADRLELCDNLVDGGTTPSYGTIQVVIRSLRKYAEATGTQPVPVNVLIRPRGGDFLYNDEELEIMLSDIAIAAKLGAYGVVLAAMNADGSVDVPRMKILLDCVKQNTKLEDGSIRNPLSVTFQRAIDMSSDPFGVLDTIIDLGIQRVLTSGGAASAPAGAQVIKGLVERANNRIIVMAGAGVTPSTVADLVSSTGVHEVHGSVRSTVVGGMTFRKPGVHLGGEKVNNADTEYIIKCADTALVAEMKAKALTAAAK